MNRLVCLGWISKPERKENFFLRDAGTTQNPAQTPTALLDIVTDAAVTQWELGNNANAQRNASHRGGRPQSRLFVTIGIRISLTNLTFELIPTMAAAARARY